ncbi:Putative threonine/lysine efflux protein family [Vibrio nigripulchritudo SOn1]|uniref:Threonine/lysine efflux protein family n=1 Tax=Vibrio nigripulchritudo SOn1 TaxID=1238450 RepID=A0AAV2VSC3_9VIBR|nr:LysE family translocator [Vibrio nigripulchritudo]CCO47345.1 Putative threonine/lysine efflux protein family [Vibrio nigripulchritudo SOn1]
MDLLQLLLFIPACFALNMTPGPNNLLSLNNARCYGFRTAFIAGLGRIAAFAVMIALAASGLAAVLYASETIFFAIKLVGAAYLLLIAFQLWRSEASPVQQMDNLKSKAGLAKQEFALAAGNPKAILIFTAFLPQFVDTSGDINTQFAILGSLFLLLELSAISLYALSGLYLRHWFERPRMARLFNRGCALFLGVSGGSLLVSKPS